MLINPSPDSQPGSVQSMTHNPKVSTHTTPSCQHPTTTITTSAGQQQHHSKGYVKTLHFFVCPKKQAIIKPLYKAAPIKVCGACTAWHATPPLPPPHSRDSPNKKLLLVVHAPWHHRRTCGKAERLYQNPLPAPATKRNIYLSSSIGN